MQAGKTDLLSLNDLCVCVHVCLWFRMDVSFPDKDNDSEGEDEEQLVRWTAAETRRQSFRISPAAQSDCLRACPD